MKWYLKIRLSVILILICGCAMNISASVVCRVDSLNTSSTNDRSSILALKTNLLYDAVSLVNFSIEAPLYKDKFSLLYYHQFPWWTWGENSNEYCVRFLSIGAEARWWFHPSGKDRFTGHFLGAYSESGKYDFGFQHEFCYQGEFWTSGLSYGYSMPISKKGGGKSGILPVCRICKNKL